MIVSSLCNAGTKFSKKVEEGMEEKRRGWGCVLDSDSKRQKPDLSTSPTTKESVSAKIVALQQLVSPYGKTDTASVLLEAMEYIQFLHDQVKVLSAPYVGGERLRSRGLCLVPLESTAAISRTNGADIWAPVNSNSH